MTVKGQFERYDGTLDLRREPAIELTINAASLDTGNAARDKHLRIRCRFLQDIENDLQVRFVSESAELDGRASEGQRPACYAAGTSTPLELEATCGKTATKARRRRSHVTPSHRRLSMSSGMLGMIRFCRAMSDACTARLVPRPSATDADHTSSRPAGLRPLGLVVGL